MAVYNVVVFDMRIKSRVSASSEDETVTIPEQSMLDAWQSLHSKRQ